MDILNGIPGMEFIQESLGLTKFIIVPFLFVGVCSLYFGYFLAKNVYTGYIAQGVEWMPSEKTWAIVTGATDGIGLEYTKRFAQMGYSLLLLSRNKAKLEETKTKLLAEYENCKQINVLDVDFTGNDIHDKIAAEVNKLEVIDVLVNNVGMAGKSTTEYFLETSDDMQAFIPALINCNMLSMTRMIQIVLPKMLANKRGIIINNASTAGTLPLPLLAQYSASKAYMDYLSRALEMEYSDQGIVIQSLLPGVVATKLVDLDSSVKHVGIPSAKDYVSAALKTVGTEKRTYGHWIHKLQFFIKDTSVMVLGMDNVCTLALKQQLKHREKNINNHGRTLD